MTCDTLYEKHGRPMGFACSRGRRARPKCKECGRPSTKQCDYPLRGKRAGETCDAHLCDAHAVKMGAVKRLGVGDDTVDYCPAHAEASRQGELVP